MSLWSVVGGWSVGGGFAWLNSGPGNLWKAIEGVILGMKHR